MGTVKRIVVLVYVSRKRVMVVLESYHMVWYYYNTTS